MKGYGFSEDNIVFHFDKAANQPEDSKKVQQDIVNDRGSFSIIENLNQSSQASKPTELESF